MPTKPLTLRIAILLATISVTGVNSASADEGVSHLRPIHATVNPLIDEGLRRSPTLRLLIRQLQASDVFAYIDVVVLPSSLTGRLNLMGAGDGWRYVRIQVNCRQPFESQVAGLAHELQHAVEIANARAATDVASVRRLYQSIGFAVDARHDAGFETAAAFQTGNRVRHELVFGTSDRPLAVERSSRATE